MESVGLVGTKHKLIEGMTISVYRLAVMKAWIIIEGGDGETPILWEAQYNFTDIPLTDVMMEALGRIISKKFTDLPKTAAEFIRAADDVLGEGLARCLGL